MAADNRLGHDGDGYATFTPRPDDLELEDQQTSFFHSDHKGVSVVLGGNGCLPYGWPIDSPDGTRPIHELTSAHRVYALCPQTGQRVITGALPAYKKGEAEMIRFDFSDGTYLRCTAHHAVLLDTGVWSEAGQLRAGDSLLDAQSSKRKAKRSHNIEPTYASEQFQLHGRSDGQSKAGYDREDLGRRFEFRLTHPMTFPVSLTETTKRISMITHEETEPYYDFEVPFYGNYQSTGLFHANSGTTTLSVAKACKFLLETPPPRMDCPFWFLASSYDQATKVLFKEKIWLGGLIPSEMFDWERAAWYKSKERLPYSLPLKKHENGNNWMMSFLSYEQSLGQMMAQATAGFMFCEQFDWIILEEVLRGTREYSFSGNKIIEFTPVKPELSIALEEMIENGELPEDPAERVPGMRYMPNDWGVYYCNTEASLKHGQVDQAWYDSFFAMIPEEMRAVRQKGRFATYEGVIFSQFSPVRHVIGDDIWLRMAGGYHYRGLDWGGGPHNAFACVWGCRLDNGQWLIYDEYESTNQDFTVVDHLCEIQKRWEWPNSAHYGTTYCDPSDPANLRIAAKIKTYTIGRDDDDQIRNMTIHRARNAVHEGIEHVRFLLKPTLPVFNETTGETDYVPRLLIHRDCKKLIRCLRTYRWKKDAHGIGAKNPEHVRPEPLKLNDHLVDSARYLVYSQDSALGVTIESASTLHTQTEWMPAGQVDRFAHRTGRR